MIKAWKWKNTKMLKSPFRWNNMVSWIDFLGRNYQEKLHWGALEQKRRKLILLTSLSNPKASPVSPFVHSELSKHCAVERSWERECICVLWYSWRSFRGRPYTEETFFCLWVFSFWIFFPFKLKEKKEKKFLETNSLIKALVS